MNDCALNLMGESQEEDRRQIAEMVLKVALRMALRALMALMSLMASLPSCVFTDSRPVHFVAAAATRLVVLGAGEQGGPQPV